ncbi:PD-(D/E)XK nuclease family protein [Tumebacillus permanentifrigoris]|uniref:ATP-dependent helicase/DNAse subunit B n=1 Tax=Tumebacillus permanentifrigoris TaxID=378543 RepID=A0A316DCY0_9BACL|nr:PD-(D/E)XK nuclease family protein [Tumebacillus permanentifrigoris]PWK13175.1 ATP-dependent helicase/DNAse subunit B [Tumebacillus permanentifrigoris]
MREVICGPFHSGHRDEWAAEFRTLVEGGRAQTCLYVVPTRGLAGVVRDRVLDGLPGMAGEQILTLFEVVEEVLRRSGKSYVRLDALATERLVAKVLRSLGRAGVMWNGESLEHWAHSPGVVSAFQRHIGELKRSRVNPTDILTMVRGTADEATVSVLAQVYTEYQQALHSGEIPLLDTEETYLEAGRVLRQQGVAQIFPGVEQVFFDYFVDFQPHQMDVVIPLLHAERVQVFLPYDPERWAWMESAAGLMQESMKAFRANGLQIRYEDEVVAVNIPADLQQVQSRLFAPHPQALEKTPSLHAFRARTAEKEWLWVAKQIKRLHQNGVALRDIAILTPEEVEHGGLIHRVLTRVGVPVQQNVSLRADRVPWLRDLLTLYTLDDAAWHRDTLEVLAGADALLGDHPLRGKQTVPQRVSRQIGVVKGLSLWQKRLAEHIGWDQKAKLMSSLADGKGEHAAPDALEEDADELRTFAAFVDLLAAKVALLPRTTDGGTHATAMRALLPEQGDFQRALVGRYRKGDGYSLEDLQRDLRARESLEKVLDALEHMDALLDETSSYSRAEFVEVLSNYLHAEQIVLERGKPGGVALLNPSAARGLTFRHVFFVGLNEGKWPLVPSTSWLLRDALREELTDRVSLLAPQVQIDQQRLFLLMGLHTATAGVWFSTVSASKQDLPSRFLSQLCEICPTMEIETDDYLGGSALYPQSPLEISNTVEARDWLAALHRRVDISPEDIVAAQALTTLEPEFWRQVYAQSEGEQARAASVGASRFDGLLEAAEIRAELADRYSTERIYSVSQFNRYGECGYKFFLSRVLNLDSTREEDAELSAMEKGNLYHRVLHRLYDQLREADRVTPEFIETMRAQIPAIFEEEWALAQTQRYTEVGLRQQLEKDRLLRRLHDWFEGEADAWQKQGLALVPRYLEWVFGMTTSGDHDPNSRLEPITIGDLKLRGQIDRIDATRDGQFMVVDYKAKNTKPMPRAIQNGTDFQLPVYMRAVEQALFPKGEAVGAAYYSIEKVDRSTSALVKAQHLDSLGMGKKKTKFDESAWNELLAQSEAKMHDYRQRMADGSYPVLPSDDSHCTFCEYRRVCRHQALRTLQADSAKGGASE